MLAERSEGSGGLCPPSSIGVQRAQGPGVKATAVTVSRHIEGEGGEGHGGKTCGVQAAIQ